MSRPIDLPDVTVCAADSAFVDLTARALTISMSECRFGDAILFSDVAVEGPFRHVRIAPLNSVVDYSRFCLCEMVEFIETPLVLVVQWDGYVVNPHAWANAFRKYDYIGAAWHGLFRPGVPMVGNGGFSLRSRKLLQAVQRLSFPPAGEQREDRLICHVHATRLEREFGIRFAPVRVADRFAYQYRIPEAMPFGFHGTENMWRHAGSDEDFAPIAEQIDVGKSNPNTTLALIRSCARNDRRKSARSLYLRFRKRYPPAHIETVLTTKVGAEQAACQVRELEGLVAVQVAP